MNRLTVMVMAGVLVVGCQASTSSDRATSQSSTPPPVAAAAPQPVREWAPEAFDEAKGLTTPLDQMQFLALLTKAEERNAKGDFETTAEFKARTADLAKLIAPIDPNAEYLFAPQYSDLEYNADAQAYEGQFTTSCYETFFNDALVSCEFGKYPRSVRSYVGKNGFGATADVTETQGTSVNLVMSKSAARKFRGKHDYSLPNSCPLPIEEAKTIGASGLGFAYLFKVTDAAVASGRTEYEDATVQSPESRIFHRKGIQAKVTGVVCYRKIDAKIVGVRRFTQA